MHIVDDGGRVSRVRRVEAEAESPIQRFAARASRRGVAGIIHRIVG